VHEMKKGASFVLFGPSDGDKKSKKSGLLQTKENVMQRAVSDILTLQE